MLSQIPVTGKVFDCLNPSLSLSRSVICREINIADFDEESILAENLNA